LLQNGKAPKRVTNALGVNTKHGLCGDNER
jgi:hypothetical protein